MEPLSIRCDLDETTLACAQAILLATFSTGRPVQISEALAAAIAEHEPDDLVAFLAGVAVALGNVAHACARVLRDEQSMMAVVLEALEALTGVRMEPPGPHLAVVS